MTTFRRIVLLVAAVAAADYAAASTISGIGVVNNSDPNVAINENGERLREFRTEATTPAAATVAGNTASFTNRFAWMSAQRVLPGGTGADGLWVNLVDYDLAFTIEDPAHIGYTLSFESLFRGYVTADWDFELEPAAVLAQATTVSAQLDTGGGLRSIPELATSGGIAFATDFGQFENVLVSDSGAYDAGTFFGTQTFQLRFTTLTIALLSGLTGGEADLRFGLDPTLTDFANANYPGIDGEAPDGHGHFVTVNATFLTAAVPEGDTGVLLGLGFGLLVVARRFSVLRLT